MSPRRHAQPPPLVCSSRSLLPAETCPALDAVLKQLKACSRRLQPALASHRTELQVLERLYYKGKNQHRTALFWQRVSGMRRLGERVDEMHMDDVVESLRLSFWGDQPSRTPKRLKGPWTHHPNAKVLLFVLERCSAAYVLIERAQERLMGAYESFTLMMQTGAFLQFIVVLAAIASRMRILLAEVRSALETSWSAGFAALEILFPSETGRVNKLSRPTPPIDSAQSRAVRSQSKTPTALPIPQDVPEGNQEDLGRLLRPTLPVDDDRVTKNPSLLEEETSSQGHTEHVDFETFSLSTELALTRTVEPEARAAIDANSDPTPSSSNLSAPKRKKSNPDDSKPAKKKKSKKRDEIDDIFGF